MRKLIHIPLLAASSGVPERGITTGALSRQLQFWGTVTHYLEGRKADTENPLDPSRVTIYHEGLPHHERFDIARFVEENAAVSSNIKIIKELKDQGASIIGTENILLITNWATTNDGVSFAEKMRARDAYIGERINETLPEDHTGIIFLGPDHNLTPHIKTDILFEVPQELRKFQEGYQETRLPHSARK